MKVVPLLGNNLYALGMLTDALNPPKRQLNMGRHMVDYLMGDASGLGLSYVLWRQGRLSSESGEFCPLYQGSLSIFR